MSSTEDQVVSPATQASAPRRSGEVCRGMVAQPPASMNSRFF
jgi:hypothetical protein